MIETMNGVNRITEETKWEKTDRTSTLAKGPGAVWPGVVWHHRIRRGSHNTAAIRDLVSDTGPPAYK